MIPKEEFIFWKQNLVTIELHEVINNKLEELKNYLAFGGTLGDSTELFTARAVGRAEALQDILDWYPVEEEEDES